MTSDTVQSDPSYRMLTADKNDSGGKCNKTVNVLLSGSLKLDGYGREHPESDDGTLRLSLGEGSTVQDLIRKVGVPFERVSMAMINARRCKLQAGLRSGDRVILIPPDVAALWRFFGQQNLGAESVFDF